jgi:NO-binding membrane sensor protein with MHYT domain
MTLPSLPPGGPLRLLAITGSLALIIFVIALVIESKKKDWRNVLWGALPIVAAIATIALSGMGGWLHRGGSFLTLAFACRNALVLQGWSRIANAVGGLFWLAGIIAARLLFI